MRQLFLFCFLFLFCTATQAQKKQLNNNYIFKEGIYLSLQEFAKDSPSYSLRDFSLEETGAGDFNTKQYKFKTNWKGTAKGVAVELKETDIWGICVQGIPYFNCTF